MVQTRRLRDRDMLRIALAVAAVAFAVRLVWILRVQSPHGAVYSDMAGYVERAEQLLGLKPVGDPRFLAFWPWGAHVLFAAEFAVFGRQSLWGIAIVHALVGAIPVACVALLTARVTNRKITAGLAGVLAALWQPQIAYAAFFMSELWFTAALLTATWLFVRHTENEVGSFGAGCALAIAFVVRPQVLLTCCLVALALAPRILVAARSLRSFSPRALVCRSVPSGGWWRPLRWAALLLPLVLAIGASSYRLHALSGRLGLISENDRVMRIFGSTSVSLIQATWKTPDGQTLSAWFSPAMQHPVREQDTVRFDGYVADPDILDRVREERLRGVTLAQRLRRIRRNVEHLVLRNYPNPEEDFSRDPARAFLQRAFRSATLALLPLALVGLWAMRRPHPAVFLVILANLGTVIVVAAFFYAEARYRVPYDPFLIIAAVVGADAIARQLRRLRGATRRARA